MNDSEIIELNNKDEEFNGFDYEIDPFASEKGDSNSEISENFSEFYDNNVDQFKVHVPMVSSNEITVEICVPFTISELLNKLKEEQATIFDSNEEFNGRIYCNNKRILKNESELIENESAKIVLIHNLVSEKSEPVQIVPKTKSKPNFMSKFKNLWTIKEKEKISIDFELENLNLNTETGIPELIEEILNFLRREEMVQEGLFRLSGTFTRIKLFQDRLNSGEKFCDLNLTASDCHNVTSLLKQFLRNLPEPLLTFELYEAWQALGGWTSQPEIAIKIANFLINQLPKLNKKILEELMNFLNERLKDSETTRMNACNFGTVVGPNLLWHSQEDRQMRDSTTLGLSLQSSTLASQICTLFLQNYEEIFGETPLYNDPVMAYGKVLYDYGSECGCCQCEAEAEGECESGAEGEGEDGDSSIGSGDFSINAISSNSVDTTATTFSESLQTGQIIFITRIEDSFDGWWLAYISRHLSKFPSNYVQVIAQRSDEELIKLL